MGVYVNNQVSAFAECWHYLRMNGHGAVAFVSGQQSCTAVSELHHTYTTTDVEITSVVPVRALANALNVFNRSRGHPSLAHTRAQHAMNLGRGGGILGRRGRAGPDSMMIRGTRRDKAGSARSGLRFSECLCFGGSVHDGDYYHAACRPLRTMLRRQWRAILRRLEVKRSQASGRYMRPLRRSPFLTHVAGREA